MTWFEQSITSTATVQATQDQVWAALTDPELLPRLTPFLRRIEVSGPDGGTWRWVMGSVGILGADLAPTFTERMTFTEKSRIEFDHEPPAGQRERAGVQGWYSLEDAGEGRTTLGIELGVRVDLPFPAVAGPGVRSALKTVLAGMGRTFSARLLQHLGAG